jgi:hypothetical protein
LIGGGLCSGVVLWLLSGLTQPIPQPWRYAAGFTVAVLAVLRDLGWVTIRLPQNARQVPQDVLRSHLVRGALQFGFELGTGVRTYVSAAAPYALAVALLLVGQRIEVAVLAGLGFGAGRAATPLLRYASAAGEHWDVRIRRRIRVVTVLCSATLAAGLGLLLLW